MKIGYVGLGALGSNLAQRFLADHALTVCDLNPAALEKFRGLGAGTATTAADLGRTCDIVFTCLPRSSDVHAVLFGPDGLAEGLTPGKLVIDQTSGVPAQTRSMAERLEAQGVAMMDASVSANPAAALQGGATLMAAAPQDIFDRALPALQAITKTVHRCGDRVGDGQAMKMVNNAMNGGNRVGVLEVAALGRGMGLSLSTISEALHAGSGRNQIVERMLPAMIDGRASTDFALALMIKDMSQAVHLGVEFGAPMPISATVCGLMQLGLNTHGKHARLEDLITLTEAWSGQAFAGEAGSVRDDAAALVNSAAEALSTALTYECVAAGLKYGLRLEEMSRVLPVTSGWSTALRRIIPALLAGEQAGDEVAPTVAALQATTVAANDAGVPTMILNVVRGAYEAALNEGIPLPRWYERSAGLRFSEYAS